MVISFNGQFLFITQFQVLVNIFTAVFTAGDKKCQNEYCRCRDNVLFHNSQRKTIIMKAFFG